MKFSVLARRNPSIDPQVIGRYVALYKGGSDFLARITEFLPHNPEEHSDTYLLRQKDSACYTPYISEIVDSLTSQLFAAPYLIRMEPKADGSVVRSGSTPAAKKPDTVEDPFYADFKEDVDLADTDLTCFMKDRFTQALITGSSWWLAEMPDPGDAPIESALDYEEQNLGRARLVPLDTIEVYDWQCDRYGAFEWVITHKKEMRRDDPRQEREMVTETFQIFDRENVETFQAVYELRKKPMGLRATDDVPSLGSRPHRFPRVPIIQMRLPQGLWLMNRAAAVQLEHFRLTAAMSWSLKRSAYPMWVFKQSPTVDGSGDRWPIMGAGYITKINADEELECVTAPTDSFESLHTEIESKKDEIYRVVTMMAHSVDNSAATAGRSGESKDADNAATEITLHAFSQVVKDAIEATYELISDARGDTNLTFSIEGMDNFDRPDATSTMDLATLAQGLTATGIFSRSDTLRKELDARISDWMIPNASQTVKDQMRAEFEEKPEKVIPPILSMQQPQGHNPPSCEGTSAEETTAKPQQGGQ